MPENEYVGELIKLTQDEYREIMGMPTAKILVVEAGTRSYVVPLDGRMLQIQILRFAKPPVAPYEKVQMFLAGPSKTANLIIVDERCI